ncbi:hypothetical protein Bca52824_073935 [Brassica carinata]|uniref:Uncharacterized protein n=1 Tax=Brassica carinata TaxID=52824 RepID=A0A8X7U8G2_BRACI|nr:hypothetical protein Bca52824_073935 [Brassica carinata]
MNDKSEGKKEVIGSGLGRDWSELNREYLIDILSRLSLEERWSGPMLVCKPWMYACDDPSLNSVFDLYTWFERSRISNLWYSYEKPGVTLDSFLRCVVDRSQGGLKEIRVRHCSDQSLLYAAESCPKLEVIWIKNCLDVTDVSMAKIASNCLKLRELDISNSIEISKKALKMVEGSCKNVKIIMEPPSNRVVFAERDGFFEPESSQMGSEEVHVFIILSFFCNYIILRKPGVTLDSFLRCVVDRSQGGLKEIRVRHCSDQSLLYAAERYRCYNIFFVYTRSWPGLRPGFFYTIYF